METGKDGKIVSEQMLITDDDRGLAVAEPPDAPLADLRHTMMTLPPEDQRLLQAEYIARRTTFRDWLRSQLVAGTHFGFPPGCEPKSRINTQTGETEYEVWMKGGAKWFPESQWKPRPELYKAGADFICDLLGVDPKWEADLAGWQQLGSPAGTFVYACKLFSKANGKLLGEGRGCRKVGQKGGDENNAIKMCLKSSKVDAVINTYGLSDLFCQDVGPMPPPHDNPDPNPEAPREQPRGKREPPAKQEVTGEQCGELLAAYLQLHPNSSKGEFFGFVCKCVGRQFDVQFSKFWTREDYDTIDRALSALEAK